MWLVCLKYPNGEGRPLYRMTCLMSFHVAFILERFIAIATLESARILRRKNALELDFEIFENSIVLNLQPKDKPRASQSHGSFY